MTGTIIGVGLFSLPFITSKVGILTMLFYFFLLGAVSVLVNFLYSEVVLRTKEVHRLPGYAGKYLGKWQKGLAFLTNGFGLVGALLAYIIVGGSFIFLLLNPIFNGSQLFYTLIFFAIGAILIYFGIKSIAQVESILLIFFFVVLGFLFNKGFPFIEIKNLSSFNIKYLFLPYGAILFSLAGTSLIPEIREILKDQAKDLKKVIFWSVFISVLVYLIFIFVVTGITGENTSFEAISGLKNILGDGIITAALIFGFLTVFTSFLTVGLTLKKILWYDLGMKKDLSWLMACFTPLLFYFLGFDNFITVISLAGGVFLGIDVTIMILIYLKAKKYGELTPAYSFNFPRLLIYSLILFFILGAIYEILYFRTYG